MKSKNCLWFAVLVAVSFFLTGMPSFGYEERYIVLCDNQSQDKWFGSLDNRDAINDSTLRVGGWGSWYYTLIKMPVHFNVPGTSRIIITKANMKMYSFDSKNPTSMHKWFVRSSWSETSESDQWGVTINQQGQIPAPPVNGLYSFDITQEFYAWLTGAEPNYGILLRADNVDNKFNYFRSSENKPEWQPYIEVLYEKLPRFKMPLPGNKAWKLTVEAGGKAYDSQDPVGDDHHTGITYYSLDFSPRWKPLSGGNEQIATDPPVYAPAGGVIYQVGESESNGKYVRIDHDYDKNPNTGFQTVCIHLKDNSMVYLNQIISQGQQIGVMGNTGSTDVHLHITFYFNAHGGTELGGWGDSAYLNLVRMDNRLLKDYDLDTEWDSGLGQYTPIYYQSTNTE